MCVVSDSGRLRALGTSSAKGLGVLPDVRPIADTYTGFDHTDWYGIMAPANTPAAIVNRVNREINAALADPKLKAQLAELGAQVFTGTPEDYGRYLRGEIERWKKVIEFSGAKAEQ